MSEAHRLQLRPRGREHSLYSGWWLLVSDRDGQLAGRETQGLYFQNTRLLSRDELLADGRRLRSFAASPAGASRLLAYAMVPEGSSVPGYCVFVELDRTLDRGLRSEIRVQNYNPSQTARFELALRLEADFADIEEVIAGERQQSAEVDVDWSAERGELRFSYRHPELPREARLRLERTPLPPEWREGLLRFPLELAPHRPLEITLLLESPQPSGGRRPWLRTLPGSLRPLSRTLREETPRLVTSNPTVARAWRTAVADLASLPFGLADAPYAPIAGLPLYHQLFARDVLTVGLQAPLAGPRLLHDALRASALRQGRRVDDWRDEEPGRLLHQAREGPLSLLGIDPFERYYGDYSAPFDFLVGLGQYAGWTGDRETLRELLPAAKQVIAWAEDYADLDGDGFLEYRTGSPKGVRNQGWKDSPTAILDERGQAVEPPIATCEVQAYWYAGLSQAAFVAALLGERAFALDLLGRARRIKKRVNDAFWMEDEGFYALALGPDKRLVRSISSNPGHLLLTDVAPPQRGRAVARRLMRPDLFSGWGVRTLSSSHPGYNPFGYHVGSVWPVENGTFAFGFSRFGCIDELHRLAEATFAATELFVENRLPEVIGGIERSERHPHPGVHPDSNEPQAWSASAVVLLVQALLGIRPMAPAGLLLVDPHLPPWLPDLRLEGVRVGRAVLTLEFGRDRAGRTGYRVVERDGRVRVVRQPQRYSPAATPRRRLTAVLGSLGRM